VPGAGGVWRSFLLLCHCHCSADLCSDQVHHTGPRFLLGEIPWLPGHFHVELLLRTTATMIRLRVLPENAGVYLVKKGNPAPKKPF
jgi:hypothetical protein